MTVVAEIPTRLSTYLDRLVEALESAAELDAVYLLGSAALGAYEQGSSDVDVVAVTSRSLSPDERRALAEAAEAIPCPARKLELVVYPRGSDAWEINLNTGEHVSYDTAEEPAFWFVLDRAIAEEHAVPLVGPPWGELFAPVPREALLDALGEALEWQEREDPDSRSAVLNASRAWCRLETGRWVAKQEAAQWLRDKVRGAIEEAR
jgi:predicted nucleotidyltransferase